ncbi:MAG: glycoside hydrolase family 27 protein [Lachnospiraceae bacterium]|nr:glycoside hydrolase family 27 protein [Lachnospiraceae bacterium]
MVAKTPPMGWNSWDCYGAAVTEDIVRANAGFMAANLKQYGWEYIVVDIQWYEPTAQNHYYHNFTELCMDEYSRLLPAVNRFPSAADGKGFAPLADYVHSLGLKFGIHIMRGIPRQAVHQNTQIKGTAQTARQIAAQNSICEWNTDMYGVDCSKEGAQAYYDSLFELYASWGVDFVKVDDICRGYPVAEVEAIAAAIRHCGRDMVLSLSPGPARLDMAEHMKQYANMWRITDDFWDRWNLLYNMFERAEKWCIHSGVTTDHGHWPDADMLPIGPINQVYDKANRTNFTKDEQRTMLTLWSILRSPLMIGGDMTGFDKFTMSLLTNPELIKVVNHTHSAHPLYRKKDADTETCAWSSTYENGELCIALFNLGETKTTVSAALPFDGTFTCYDIWNQQTMSSVTGEISVELLPHGAAMFRLSNQFFN